MLSDGDRPRRVNGASGLERILNFRETDWQGLTTALLIGIVSGLIADHFAMPLPWMLGPMIGNTVAAIMRVPLSAPVAMRPFVIPVIGVLLGSGFHPEILDRAADWLATLIALPFFVVCCSGLSFCFYRYVARYDHVTAVFSGMPGGLSEMLIMGTDAGGNERRIALAHASRILIIVTFVVLFYDSVLDVSVGVADRTYVALTDIPVIEALVLAACGLVGIFAARRLNLPAALMLGPMVLSAAAHLTGLVESAPPTLLVYSAQLVIGTIIGCRFANVPSREIARDLLYGIGAASMMIAIAIAFAQLISLLTGADIRQSFLAFSPGGLTEMSLLALAMGQDIVYVSVSHVVRITLVVFMAPLLYKTVLSQGGPGSGAKR